MLDDLCTSPRALARARASWLREAIDDFLGHLSARRFNRSTLRLCASRLLAFGEFTASQGVRQVTLLPQSIEPFVAQLDARTPHRRNVRQTLARFVRFLQARQLIPQPQPLPPAPHDHLIGDYVRCLSEQRGLCHDSLVLIRRPCRAFLDFVAAEGIAELRCLPPEVIHRFVICQGKRYCRRTLRSHCQALRGFLSFLHRRGVVAADLAGAVLAPRVYQHESCPRFLTRTEIDSVLAAIDRRTAVGRRDYAMTLLLAVYGLRGGEVVRLSLDDLDWRRQLLHVRRRKAGNSTTYPLSAAAGDAVVAYLRGGRPSGPHRQVFLTTRAPFGPLASGDALANQVRKYLQKAGIRVERPGTHSFRYSCAQRLFEAGTPLKTIGDYLGHRDPTVTQRYTKIALEQLREVAQGDGEDLLVTPGERRHGELDRADAERVWAGHVTASAGERWHQRYAGRHVIAEFLDGVSVAGPSGRQHLVIDRQRVLSWMIQDAAGKTPRYAAERFAILDRFLGALARAGLVSGDLLAEHRTGRGRPSWHCLVRALQAEDSRTALATLRPPPPPAGPLTVHVRSYFELQRSLGKGYQAEHSTLSHLDRFLLAQATDSAQAVTPNLIERWSDSLTCGARTRVHKVRFARAFFDYLRGLGAVARNPVTRLMASRRLPPSSFQPFIFSPEQLTAILAEAGRLPDNRMCPRRAQTCSTMLALLFALGLRHGEVRRLRIAHVDLERRALEIDQTKFHKSRYVPFGPKVGECLRQYLEVRHTLLLPVREDDPLFVTHWRKPICPKMLLDVFRDILLTLKITGVEGQPPPRLHDARHSFAVNRLLRWYREGVDVQGRLPLLSTFLGHADPRSTEVYLTITAELLREANARFHRHFGSHFDEENQP